MFMEPMKDVVYGTSTPFSFTGIVDRIKFICTAYDPGAGRYRIDYGLVFGSRDRRLLAAGHGRAIAAGMDLLGSGAHRDRQDERR